MTAAERMRRTRERRRQQGGTGAFMLTLNEPYLRTISDLATATGTSRSAALKLIVQEALTRFLLASRIGDRMLDEGATDEQMQAKIEKVLGVDTMNAIRDELKGDTDTGPA
jgi:hypothetical protein